MSVTKISRVRLKCDGCGRKADLVLPDDRDGLLSLRQSARDDGWITSMGDSLGFRDWCPECQQEDE